MILSKGLKTGEMTAKNKNQTGQIIKEIQRLL